MTLKMRLGWDDRSLNAPELARRAEAAGVQMITVHGRTRCQFYKGEADWARGARRQGCDQYSARRQRRYHLVREGGDRARKVRRRRGHGRPRRAGPAMVARSDRAPARNRARRSAAIACRSNSITSARSMTRFAVTTDCASAFAMRANISAGRWKLPRRCGRAPAATLKMWRAKILTSEDPHRVHRSLQDAFDEFAWSAAA